MEANSTISANLKGMAKHTYNRVMSAMAEDNEPSMCHTFAALTEGAKAIALQSGKFSNLYIRGERKGMAAEDAAKELTERAAACVSRKLRKIDHICAVAFLAEYISRQRKADEPTTEPTNTPTTMNANETIEFSELTHAGQCLDIYLHNTSDIYERYTVPAIDACVKAQSVKTPEMWNHIKQALKAAARLVIKYDGITPTADDIKAVSANYVAYITECAEYQAVNA